MVLLVEGQHLVEHFLLTVERESQVTNAACLALLQQIVHYAIIHIAPVKLLHAATYGMQQIVVDVINLQLLHRVVVHLLRLLE